MRKMFFKVMLVIAVLFFVMTSSLYNVDAASLKVTQHFPGPSDYPAINVGQTFTLTASELPANEKVEINFSCTSGLALPNSVTQCKVANRSYTFTATGTTRTTARFTPTKDYIGSWRAELYIGERPNFGRADTFANYNIFPATSLENLRLNIPRQLTVGKSVIIKLSGLLADDSGEITFKRSDGKTSTPQQFTCSSDIGVRSTGSRCDNGELLFTYAITSDLVGTWTATAKLTNRNVTPATANYTITTGSGNQPSGDRCAQAGGTCKNPSDCDGEVKDGLCPGGQDNKCCVAKGTKPPEENPPGTGEGGDKCAAQKGQCMNPKDCSGTVLDMLCPGGKDNKCCVSGGKEGAGGAEGTGGFDITIQDVEKIILGLTCWALRIADIAIVGFVLYSGFLFLKAQGVPANVDAAKKNLKYVIIGLAVILGVYVIIGTVANTFGRADYSFFSCKKTASAQ